jgi:hypothetical protein
LSLLAAPKAYLRLHGRANDISLSQFSSNESGFTVSVQADNPTNLTARTSSSKLNDTWQTLSFTITLDKSGKLTMDLDARATSGPSQYVAYDAIRITGADLAGKDNGDFESINKDGLPKYWWGKADASQVVSGSEQAGSGKNFVIVQQDKSFGTNFMVTAGVPVTIEFQARVWDAAATE